MSAAAGVSPAESASTGVVSAAETAAKIGGVTVLGTILAGPMGGVVASSVAGAEAGVQAALGLDGKSQDPGWTWQTIVAVAFFSVLVVWLLAKVLHEGAGVAKVTIPRVL